MAGSWFHLAARFVDVVSARPLGPRERMVVSSWLRPAELPLFLEQSKADQRHGLESAMAIAASHRDRTDLVRAALLHDIGKRHARLGAVGRVIASLWERTGLPLPARMAAYRDHGPLGAADLRRAGAEPIVVAFADAHHGRRPADFDPVDWELLQRADTARIRRRRFQIRYPDSPGPRLGEHQP